jgi:hypothetical protein
LYGDPTAPLTFLSTFTIAIDYERLLPQWQPYFDQPTAEETPALSMTERDTISMNIRDDMHTVHSDFDNGAQNAEDAIQAAAAERASVAKAIFSVGMALIVPGFGGLLSRAAARFSVTIASETANIIGSAIGDAAKSAGNEAIDEAFSDSPGQFFTAITRGFEEAQDEEREWINDHRRDRSELPDTVLRDLEEYWDELAGDYEPDGWEDWFQTQWNRYERQIKPIGTRGREVTPPSTITTGRIAPTNTAVAWVHIGNEHILVLATEVAGARRLRFERWIDRDLKELALEQAARTQGSIPSVTRQAFTGSLPTVPSSAARR